MRCKVMAGPTLGRKPCLLMCGFACVCTCSNNGSEQLCDCEVELSSYGTPECVIKVIVGPL